MASAGPSPLWANPPTMTIAYLDCFSGISGDMMLGALLDAGLPPEDLRADLARLGLSGWELRSERVRRQGLAGTQATIETAGPSPERHLSDILALIAASGLPAPVQEQASAVFTRLADAEAAVHGSDREHVHFHEVGALDSILDIVGSVAGLHRLGVEALYCSPLPLGGGFVESAHGRLPVPAPATVALLQGVPVYGGPLEAELVTPTGAALVATLCRGFGPLPALTISRVGLGAGSRDLPHPNLLRLVLGEAAATPGARAAEGERICQLETNIDNMDPQLYDHLVELLLGAGALDVVLVPAIMKKSRPATIVQVLCPPERKDLLLDLLFTETTTLGVRMAYLDRVCLARESITVPTPWGPVAVKVAHLPGGGVRCAPEFEDCRARAREAGVPLQAVMEHARCQARKLAENRSD